MGGGEQKKFKQSEQIKKLIKKKYICRNDFTPFISKSFHICDHFFPLLFPKTYENLKGLAIGLWKVGAKRPLKGVRKCDGQTDKQTYGHFDL